jgi:carbon storage regulator
MLVLSRRPGEEIIIGDNIVRTVLQATSRCVRIGIQAPRSTSIRRKELIQFDSAEETWTARSSARTTCK